MSALILTGRETVFQTLIPGLSFLSTRLEQTAGMTGTLSWVHSLPTSGHTYTLRDKYTQADRHTLVNTDRRVHTHTHCRELGGMSTGGRSEVAIAAAPSDPTLDTCSRSINTFIDMVKWVTDYHCLTPICCRGVCSKEYMWSSELWRVIRGSDGWLSTWQVTWWDDVAVC